MRPLIRAAVLVLALVALGVLSSDLTSAANTTVPMGATSIYGPFWYCDAAHSGVVCTTTIAVGDTVTWQNNTIFAHTVTECDGNCGAPNPPGPIWDSGLISPSGTYVRQFNTIGTFNYQCNVHPLEMKGQIIVQAGGSTPTPTITPTPTLDLHPGGTPTAFPTPRPVGGLSIDPGAGAPSSGGHLALFAALSAAAAAAAALFGATRYARKRARR